jgi:predicted transposase/invertase (TIGR01784 family)
MAGRKLISFDWALKRLLRSKANYEILEGFLSVLLKDDIKILEILESESNKASRDDKFNRVDLKVKNQMGEIILVEVQHEREFDYLQRILYASSKAVTEHLQESDPYSNIIKVISVNILYFDLGQGLDYVYHGTTHFKGIHKYDELLLSSKQQALFNKIQPFQIFPEYYLLKINQFDDIARDPLDEWIYFLKNEEIRDEFQAKGLKKARQALDIMQLSTEERLSYDDYAEQLHLQASMYLSSYGVGRMEGMKEGEEKGRLREKLALAKTMKLSGESLDKIALYTQLSLDEIKNL